MRTSDYGWMLLVSYQIGFANTISHGSWDTSAFALLVVTLAVVGWRFCSHVGPDRLPTRWLEGGVLVLLVSLSLTTIVRSRFISLAAHGSLAVHVARVLNVVLLATYLHRGSDAWVRLRFAGFALALVIMGVGIIRADPSPPIDVWTLQQRGAEVLLHGKNPYVWATVPDTDPENDFTVPFVYPPMVLYAACLVPDVRYALLACVVIAGFAVRSVGQRDAPALFLWHMPILVFILELAWVDALPAMFICLGVASITARRSLLGALFLGLALSSKQSMFWLYPLAGFTLRFDRRQWITMTLAAILPAAPFVIWNPAAFRYACWQFLASLPPRHDALCFGTALWKWFGVTFPAAIGFVLAAAIVAFACWRVRDVAGFAKSALCVYFVFFFFNRWAFANYYFFLTVLAVLAAATSAFYQSARVGDVFATTVPSPSWPRWFRPQQ